jgi:beta-glucosidase
MYQMAKGGGGKYGGPAPAIPRLGIGPYQWDTECLNDDVMALKFGYKMKQTMNITFPRWSTFLLTETSACIYHSATL